MRDEMLRRARIFNYLLFQFNDLSHDTLDCQVHHCPLQASFITNVNVTFYYHYDLTHLNIKMRVKLCRNFVFLCLPLSLILHRFLKKNNQTLNAGEMKNDRRSVFDRKK